MSFSLLCHCLVRFCIGCIGFWQMVPMCSPLGSSVYWFQHSLVKVQLDFPHPLLQWCCSGEGWALKASLPHGRFMVMVVTWETETESTKPFKNLSLVVFIWWHLGLRTCLSITGFRFSINLAQFKDNPCWAFHSLTLNIVFGPFGWQQLYSWDSSKHVLAMWPSSQQQKQAL